MIVVGIRLVDRYCRELHHMFQAFVIFIGIASSHPMGKFNTSRKMNLPCRITGDINPSGSYRLFKDERISPFVGERPLGSMLPPLGRASF